MFKWFRRKFKDTLIKVFGVDKQYRHGKTLLMYAAQDNDIAEVEDLIKKGASLNIQDKKGMTALMYASKNSNDKMVYGLVNKGANLEIEDKGHKKALDYALLGNNKQVVNILEGRSEEYIDKKIDDIRQMDIENPWEKEEDKKWKVDNSIKENSVEKDNWEPKEEWKLDNSVKAANIADPWENKEKIKSKPVVINEKWDIDNTIKKPTTVEKRELDPWGNNNEDKNDRRI